MSDATRRERADTEAREARHTRRRRVLAGLGVFVLVVLLGLGVAWWRLEGNISRLDVSKDLGTRPTAAAGPLNILLIGSDNREGEGVPGASLSSGARSDTTLIAHVSADREHVTVVSVPRDSMVPAPPNCTNSTPKDEWVVTAVERDVQPSVARPASSPRSRATPGCAWTTSPSSTSAGSATWSTRSVACRSVPRRRSTTRRPS